MSNLAWYIYVEGVDGVRVLACTWQRTVANLYRKDGYIVSLCYDISRAIPIAVK